jgi:hypothetical protein
MIEFVFNSPNYTPTLGDVVETSVKPSSVKGGLLITGDLKEDRTHHGKMVIEDLLADGVKVVVVSSDGGWNGFEKTVDGKSSGYDVVSIDVRDPDDATEIANTIATHSTSTAINLSNLVQRAREEFLYLLVLGLNNKNRSPMVLFLADMDSFFPANIRARKTVALDAIHDALTIGASRDIDVIGIVKTVNDVSRDILRQIGNVLATRTAPPQNIKALVTKTGSTKLKTHASEKFGIARLARGWACLWDFNDLEGKELPKMVKPRLLRTLGGVGSPPPSDALPSFTKDDLVQRIEIRKNANAIDPNKPIPSVQRAVKTATTAKPAKKTPTQVVAGAIADGSISVPSISRQTGIPAALVKTYLSTMAKARQVVTDGESVRLTPAGHSDLLLTPIMNTALNFALCGQDVFDAMVTNGDEATARQVIADLVKGGYLIVKPNGGHKAVWPGQVEY